ncbi:hypothetical protein DY000_02008999 [Brassica cretica]|uniref:non-specific serine/threonine protein kinase n=1 Tax=Brassica cretica TaxID=69181 RepID=A0ABQ7BVY1_BRACR|nr:hypothetical protein DY000_02008999 [Brassica cretica]
MASKTKIYFVLEFVTGGELFDKIASKGRLKEDGARNYFHQLINAVDYCHSRGVYHRDLKPENLLLDANWTLNVSDFGLSALPQQVQEDSLLHSTCGTPNYVAPEVINSKGYDGAKADLWSCGVILFVLMAGYLPFEDSNLASLYKKVLYASFLLHLLCIFIPHAMWKRLYLCMPPDSYVFMITDIQSRVYLPSLVLCKYQEANQKNFYIFLLFSYSFIAEEGSSVFMVFEEARASTGLSRSEVIFYNGQRITFAEVIENEWFNKGYKAPKYENANVSLDDVDAIFDESGESQKLVVERREEGLRTPVTRNAFELISTSKGLNLGSLFEKQMVPLSFLGYCCLPKV